MDKKTNKRMQQLAEGKESRKWEGLGDVVASATKAIGIKPCTPCERRRQLMNKMFSFTK
jgi:hypothetical protein